jgi:hypothetical protein
LPLGESMLYTQLGTKSTCSLTLCFLSCDVSPELVRYISAVQQRLPFKLSARCWARWQLNAAGSAYYARKTSVMKESPPIAISAVVTVSQNRILSHKVSRVEHRRIRRNSAPLVPTSGDFDLPA